MTESQPVHSDDKLVYDWDQLVNSHDKLSHNFVDYPSPSSIINKIKFCWVYKPLGHTLKFSHFSLHK